MDLLATGCVAGTDSQPEVIVYSEAIAEQMKREVRQGTSKGTGNGKGARTCFECD